MIGQRQVILDVSEWIKGMSSGKYMPDGGFSDDTEAVNMIAEPGVLYAPATLVDGDSDAILDDEIIASSPDHAAASPSDRLVVTADGDFMRYNGTKLLDVTGGQDTTQTYAKGFTDMVNFDGETYVTSKEKLARWSGTQTFDFVFASMANTALPHPLVVFENNLYIGDGNLLKRMTAAAGTPATVLTLATNEFIQALGVDPGSGKLLISIVYGQNISGTINRTNKVLWYDGFANKVIKVIRVEDMVTAFHNHSGNVIVGYGVNIGILTGSGIRFLRKLVESALDSTKLPYKHSFASMGSTMCVIDGTKVLAWGPVRTGGDNVFYYIAKNKVNSNIIDAIFNAGNNKLGMSMATSKFRTLDITSKATLDKFDFYTNWVEFPRPIILRAIYYQFVNNLSTANLTLNFDDQSNGGTERELQQLYAANTATSEFFAHGARVTSTIDTGKLYAIRLRIQNSTTNDGLKRIIIYYDFAE